MTIETSDTIVTLKFHGFIENLCFRSRIDFKRSSITKIYSKPETLFPPWLRTFGTYIPWFFVGGEFRRKAQREFWCSRYKRDSIVIELKDEEFDRIVVDVTNVKQTIKMLTEIISHVK